jgi:hypothetical protein
MYTSSRASASASSSVDVRTISAADRSAIPASITTPFAEIRDPGEMLRADAGPRLRASGA